MFRFTIRDVLLVMVMVGLAAGWGVDRLAATKELRRMEQEMIRYRFMAYQLHRLYEEATGDNVGYTIPGGTVVINANGGQKKPPTLNRP